MTKSDRYGRRLFEVKGVRLSAHDLEGFESGLDGWWLIQWDVSPYETQFCGVALNVSFEPVRIVAFRDSNGLVVKFVHGTSQVVDAFVSQWGGRVVSGMEVQDAKR